MGREHVSVLNIMVRQYGKSAIRDPRVSSEMPWPSKAKLWFNINTLLIQIYSKTLMDLFCTVRLYAQTCIICLHISIFMLDQGASALLQPAQNASTKGWNHYAAWTLSCIVCLICLNCSHVLMSDQIHFTLLVVLRYAITEPQPKCINAAIQEPDVKCKLWSQTSAWSHLLSQVTSANFSFK